MCPDCTRGLINGTLCPTCAGTGIWNPLSAKETIMSDTKIELEAGDTVTVEVAPEVTPEAAPEVAPVAEPVVPAQPEVAPEVAPEAAPAEVPAE
jgi:hypothetical protein